jgi:hypothetical protein
MFLIKMKMLFNQFKIVILSISIISAPVRAGSLGPADTLLPGETFLHRSTSVTSPKIEAYCKRWRNKCNVEVTDVFLIVNDVHKVHKDDLIYAWTNYAGGTFVYILYKGPDDQDATAQFIFTNYTSAAEFFNRLQLLIHSNSTQSLPAIRKN